MLELAALSQEKVWFDKYKYDEAEKVYFEKLAKLLITNGVPVPPTPAQVISPPEVVSTPKAVPAREVTSKPKAVTAPKDVPTPEIVSAPKVVPTPEVVSPPTKIDPAPVPSVQPVTIKIADSHTVQVEEKRFKVKDKHSKSKKRVSDKLNKDEKKMDGIAVLASGTATLEINNRINSLENENTNLKHELKDLKAIIKKLESRIDGIEALGRGISNVTGTSSKPAAPKPAPAPVKQPANPKDDDEDDGVDLFGSDSEEEDEDVKRVKEQRVAEYAAKKSKKPTLIAKSNIILDVKPWDDETDMKKLEEAVRTVATDGLVWGASKLVPLAYGIHKLQISCVVEDEKVSVDWLQESLQDIDLYVQSVDIAAFNKV